MTSPTHTRRPRLLLLFLAVAVVVLGCFFASARWVRTAPAPGSPLALSPELALLEYLTVMRSGDVKRLRQIASRGMVAKLVGEPPWKAMMWWREGPAPMSADMKSIREIMPSRIVSVRITGDDAVVRCEEGPISAEYRFAHTSRGWLLTGFEGSVY